MDTDNRKITVLHAILSLDVGGMEQVAADLALNLDPERFTPVIVCLELLGDIAVEVARRGIRVIKLPAMTPLVSFLYPAPLVSVIRETGADIVHAHSGCWFKAAVAARLAGVKKIVYTDHGRAVPDRLSRIILERLACTLTKSVVAVSPQLAGYMRDVVRIPDSKLSVILNGIDTKRFLSARRETGRLAVRIGVVARLEPVKDIGTLLRAMKIVTAELPDATLEIAGTGSELEALGRLAGELGIGDRVRFHGMRRDVPEFLAGLDIYALSSVSEGTSVSILEAMASGLPVVATRVGGNPSLIGDGEDGLLVPPGNPYEMARALLRMAGDAGLRLRMGTTGREKAEREYSVGAMTRGYERLYRSL